MTHLFGEQVLLPASTVAAFTNATARGGNVAVNGDALPPFGVTKTIAPLAAAPLRPPRLMPLALLTPTPEPMLIAQMFDTSVVWTAELNVFRELDQMTFAPSNVTTCPVAAPVGEIFGSVTFASAILAVLTAPLARSPDRIVPSRISFVVTAPVWTVPVATTAPPH